MSLLFALLILTVPPKEPQIYYFNSRRLVPLNEINMPNLGHAVLKFFIHSPYELSDARIDSSDAGICLPDIAQRRRLRLHGRWYTISWNTRLSPGSSSHKIFLFSFRHARYEKTFRINVEGTKRLEKPMGVN